jgi:triacylglycerol lipase
MGHSAGATHVATYVGHKEFHGPNGSGLAGAILLSGTYDQSAAEPTPDRIAYYGSDRSLYGTAAACAAAI